MTALQTIFLVSVFIVSLILNVSFTAIVIVHKALHQEDIMLNLVLTVTNICFSALSNIPNIASVVNGGWPLGKVFCYVDGTMNFFLAISRHAFLLAITMDRFGLVMYPFSFRRHRSKTAAVILLVGVLYSAAVSIVFNANVVGCYNFDQNVEILIGDLYTLVPIADALVVWRNRDVKECAIAACRRMRQVLQNHAFGNNY
ncbi:hypothetical protein EMCRGX_G009386 [Ephydatia muelleri]